MKTKNPWSVTNIEEFHFYCCPECNVKDHSKEIFFQHALEKHSNNAKDFLENILSIQEIHIKTEENSSENPLGTFHANHEENSKIKVEKVNAMIEHDENEISKNSSNLNEEFYEEDEIYDEILETKSEIKEEIYDRLPNSEGNDIEFEQHDFENDDAIEIKKTGTNFQCFQCFKTYETSQEELTLHIKSAHKELKNLCDICAKQFTLKCNLTSHKKAVHEGIRNFKCNHCHFAFASSWGLKKHMKSHNRRKSFSNQCNICFMEFSSADAIKIHVNTIHEGMKNFKCEICTNAFATDFDLQKHHKRMHNESLTIHECPKCEYTSTEAGRVRKHVKMVHEGERPYPCSLCEKAYANSSDLKRHKKTIHENQGKIIHKCYYCDLTFEKLILLKIHLQNVHEGLEDPICDICHSAFHDLPKHKLNMHSGINNYPCKHCQMEFKSSAERWRHSKNVHEEKNETNKEKQYLCDKCEKSYFLKSQLKQHIKIVHEKLRDEKCEICGKGFAVRSQLSQHINKVHNKQKQKLKSKDHQCSICGISFSEKHELKRHILRVHEKVKDLYCPWPSCNRGFYGAQHLKRHIMRIHEKSWNYEKSDRENFAESSNNP